MAEITTEFCPAMGFRPLPDFVFLGSRLPKKRKLESRIGTLGALKWAFHIKTAPS